MHSKKLWVNRNEISQIRLLAVVGVSSPSQHRQTILMDVNVKKRERERNLLSALQSKGNCSENITVFKYKKKCTE